MKHIPLDSQDEAVKRFILSVPIDAEGSVLELNGQPVACLVPPVTENGESSDTPWTDEKDERRCDLIDREIDGKLTPAEAMELHRLQREMLRHRHKVAPLPLEDARKLHQELQIGRASCRERV